MGNQRAGAAGGGTVEPRGDLVREHHRRAGDGDLGHRQPLALPRADGRHGGVGGNPGTGYGSVGKPSGQLRSLLPVVDHGNGLRDEHNWAWKG